MAPAAGPVAEARPWLLPLPARLLAALPPTWARDGVTYVRKTELHLTVLGRADRAAVEVHPRASRLLAHLTRFAEAVEPTLPHRRTGRLLALADPPRRSVVELLELPEAHRLAARLRAEGFPAPTPVPHVTLYVAGEARGLSLRSPDALCARLAPGPRAMWPRLATTPEP